MTQHFTLTLRVAPGRDGIRSLRALLKVAWRHFGLRAITVCETTNTTPPRRSVGWWKTSSARKSKIMDMRKFSGSTFIKCEDVRSGPLKEKIAGVVLGQYGKPDLIFERGAKLSVNATNNKVLIRAFGIDSEDWIGQTVKLFLGEIDYQGKPQEAVLLRAMENAPQVEANFDDSDEI